MSGKRSAPEKERMWRRWRRKGRKDPGNANSARKFHCASQLETDRPDRWAVALEFFPADGLGAGWGEWGRGVRRWYYECYENHREFGNYLANTKRKFRETRKNP
jgi:hypothetical protein